METGTADSGHADHRRALCGADRWFYCIALQSSADFCGKLADKDSFLYKGQSVSLCGVVSNPDGSCMDRRKTGEVGTDDFRQRDSAGGRGSIRAPFSELETSAAGKICRRIFMYAGRAFAWKRRPVDSAWSDGRTGNIQSFGAGEKRREVFDDMWGECRAFSSVSCAVGRYDVCSRRDSQNIFNSDSSSGHDGFCNGRLYCFPHSWSGSGIPFSDYRISAAKLLLAFDSFGNSGRSIRRVLQLGDVKSAGIVSQNSVFKRDRAFVDRVFDGRSAGTGDAVCIGKWFRIDRQSDKG